MKPQSRILFTFSFFIFFTFAFCLLPFALFSQSPQKFNYQAVARNGDAVLNNATIDVKFDILQGSPTGSVAWTETHAGVLTNALGLFSLKVGDVASLTVDWTSGPYYLDVKIDMKEGSGFRNFGNAELLSVPYALHAANGSDSQTLSFAGTNISISGGNSTDLSSLLDNTDEQVLGFNAVTHILSLTNGGTVNLSQYVNTDDQAISLNAVTHILTLEDGGTVDLSPYVNTDNQNLSLTGNTLNISGGTGADLSSLIDDADANPANEIQDLTLTGDVLSLTMDPTAVPIDLSPYSDNPWTLNGASNDTLLFPGSVAIGSGVPNGSKLAVQGDDVLSGKPLFEVKRKDGQTVFAVYNDSIRMYVEDGIAKGAKGGFAVGGFNPGKGLTNEYLRVTPDLVRVYIDQTQASKGGKGGFAVGGFTPGKGPAEDLMYLGLDNYFIGHQAGSSNTTGIYNTFFGYQAGTANTTGRDNIFIGNLAGTANIGANENIFIGNQSGFNTQTGYGNVYLGNQTGYLNVGGYYNSFVGYRSGYSNTSHWNSFFGYYSGYSNTTGQRNTFMGYYTGYNSRTGSNNTYLGNRAGYSAAGASAYDNVFVGVDAGYSISTGHDNVAIGNLTGRGLNTGFYNVFIGTEAGYNNQGGDYNSFIGYRSGFNNTGNYNTFFGYYSGFNLGNNTNNVLIGYQAGRNAAGGNYNVLLGSNAGYNNNGDYNVFIGYESGYNNIGGADTRFSKWNTFVGFQSGRGNTTGWHNLAIGYQAGLNNQSATNQFFIGNSAGMDLTDGYGNTFVGHSAGQKSTVCSNNTILGYFSGFDNLTGSNNVYIGYAAAINALGSDNVIIGNRAGYNNTGGGNVFIGNNVGYNETGSNLLYIDNSSTATPLIWGDFANDNLRFNANVGIGVNPSSSYKLYVRSDPATATSTTRGGYFQTFGGATSGSAYGLVSYTYAYGTSASYAIYADADGGSTTGQEYAFYGLGKGYFSGNVGLGVTNPIYRIELPNIASTSGQGRANAWVTYSDARVKSNQEIIQYGLKELMLLQPKKYDHHSSEFENNQLVIKNEYSEDIGLFAQEVYDIIPEVVSKPSSEDSDLWALNYEKLIPVLIKGIQEQQKMIEELKAENVVLTAKMNKTSELEAQIAELKALVEQISIQQALFTQKEEQ